MFAKSRNRNKVQ